MFLDFTDEGISLKCYLAENPQLSILKAFTKNYRMAGGRLHEENKALIAAMAHICGKEQRWQKTL